MTESQKCKRAPAWTEQEVQDLITVWGDESILSELHSKRRNAQTFEKISKGMKDRGYNRDPQQSCVKLKELRQVHQKTREANGHCWSGPQTCCFYDELHAILGGAATTTPPLCFDSINGVACNRDADLGTRKMRRLKIAHSKEMEKLFSLTVRNCFSPWTWSQYPPNPPKAASQTLKVEKGPLLQMFLLP
ncbi:zinc finger and SCAN domain-containing protein 32-like [Gopherus flavomarginatus]|uniref:zinc finger and SCAN domain-containing protein 32-like n=1 Tax=Gopherus flavomarginatus TaxID=286002 RepID=UPI0021CBE1C5|nr:zinc finger and SCAN domain-containing protein 32-like [Gopherus flavomarginatus]